MKWDDPQNPYDSFMVEASAGSGKTYQLSHRFINLVAAGALPYEILTITFTVKAANEMRARIISESNELLVNKDKQLEFNEKNSAFYSMLREKYPFYRFRVPRSAVESAKLILANTQLLRISTIDSLFREWVVRFSWSFDNCANKSLASSNMLDPLDLDDLNYYSWLDLFPDCENSLKELYSLFDNKGENNDLFFVENKINLLLKFYVFIWQNEYANNGLALIKHTTSKKLVSLEEVMNEISDDLSAVISSCKSKEKFMPFLNDYGGLRKLKLLTRDGKVSKVFLRGNKRITLEKECNHIENVLLTYSNFIKKKKLNHVGGVIYGIYQKWIQQRDFRKKISSKLEFSDLSKLCYELFYSQSSVGLVWLIQKSIKHLLIDEYQDTSLLQWDVFRCLVEEMLSGDGSCNDDNGVKSTVFIVGDKKQSVYGFREADPEVMKKTSLVMRTFDKKVLGLNQSYRSSKIILDFVNIVFSKLVEDFPEHRSAVDANSKYIVPNIGRIEVHDVFESDNDIKGIRKEAQYVAKTLKQALSSNSPYKVYDSNLKGFRKLLASDCCILYRNSTHVRVFEEELLRYKVPYRKEEKKGFFKIPEIQDIICLLRFMTNNNDYLSLWNFMRSSFIRISSDDLYNIIEKLNNSEDKSIDFLFNLLDGVTPSFSNYLRTNLPKIRCFLPHEIIFSIFKRLSIFNDSDKSFGGNLKEVDVDILKRNLIRLLEMSVNMESEGFTNLIAFVNRLEKLSIKDYAAVANADNKYVSLMTIHKAKGLEFAWVAIVENCEKWYKDAIFWTKIKGEVGGVCYIGKRSEFPLADVAFDRIIKNSDELAKDEANRLLYVALTRAKHYLLLTGHATANKKGKYYLDLLKESICSFPGVKKIDSGYVINEDTKDKMNEPVNELKNNEDKIIIKNSDLIPEEILLIRPHSVIETVKDGEYGDINFDKVDVGLKNPDLLAICGSYIHEGLLAAMKQDKWDRDLSWKKLFRNSRFYRNKVLSNTALLNIKRECDFEINRNIENELWNNMLKSASEVHGEMQVMSFNNEVLMRGVVDACLIYPDKVVILEYKTIACPIDLDDKNMRIFCIKQGFLHQISYYCNAVKSIYPKKRVVAYIWLTKISRPIMVYSSI